MRRWSLCRKNFRIFFKRLIGHISENGKQNYFFERDEKRENLSYGAQFCVYDFVRVLNSSKTTERTNIKLSPIDQDLRVNVTKEPKRQNDVTFREKFFKFAFLDREKCFFCQSKSQSSTHQLLRISLLEEAR